MTDRLEEIKAGLSECSCATTATWTMARSVPVFCENWGCNEVKWLVSEIERLRAELADATGTMQQCLKIVKGDKVVHSTLAKELSDAVVYLNAVRQNQANAIGALRTELSTLRSEVEPLRKRCKKARPLVEKYVVNHYHGPLGSCERCNRDKWLKGKP